MKFAKVVFWIAGIYGVLVITPLYFLFDYVVRVKPTHPSFYYGFVCVTLAWQFAFLVIATDPVRYRLVMLPAMFEKFSVLAIVLLALQGRTPSTDLVFAGIDLLLGVLFVAAFLKTRAAA